MERPLSEVLCMDTRKEKSEGSDEKKYNAPVQLLQMDANNSDDHFESDIDAGSSGIDDNNWFQKLKRKQEETKFLGLSTIKVTEASESMENVCIPLKKSESGDIEFPDFDVLIGNDNQSHKEADDIDFPEIVDDPEGNESIASDSPEILKKDIDFPEAVMETDEPWDKNIIDQNLQEKEMVSSPSTAHSLELKLEDVGEGCVLRHRIDPEPPRHSVHDDKSWEEDSNSSSLNVMRKIVLIRKALESDPVDIAALRNLAISPGGLINRSIRQQVWPLLINVNTRNITPKPSQEEMQSLTKTYTQVVMDVNRSSSRFPPGIDDHVRMSMKDKLVDLIMRVMLKNRHLKYYQGFHDVCITFLLCMDESLAFAMVDKLAMGYMREYLDETMERTSILLNYIYPLVNRCNPELCQHMERNDLGTIFALSWVITWFSHVLGDIRRILRVFDFFLASHRMMPVYLSAAFVLYREQDIYAAGDEMGYIHKCLSTIPDDLPLELLLKRAGDLYLQLPPTEISRDPMLIRMNRQVYEHFNCLDSRNASRNLPQPASDMRSRLFVKITMWTVTAVVGVAAAVLYHSYMGQGWTMVEMWSPFS